MIKINVFILLAQAAREFHEAGCTVELSPVGLRVGLPAQLACPWCGQPIRWLPEDLPGFLAAQTDWRLLDHLMVEVAYEVTPPPEVVGEQAFEQPAQRHTLQVPLWNALVARLAPPRQQRIGERVRPALPPQTRYQSPVFDSSGLQVGYASDRGTPASVEQVEEWPCLECHQFREALPKEAAPPRERSSLDRLLGRKTTDAS